MQRTTQKKEKKNKKQKTYLVLYCIALHYIHLTCLLPCFAYERASDCNIPYCTRMAWYGMTYLENLPIIVGWYDVDVCSGVLCRGCYCFNFLTMNIGRCDVTFMMRMRK